MVDADDRQRVHRGQRRRRPRESQGAVMMLPLHELLAAKERSREACYLATTPPTPRSGSHPRQGTGRPPPVKEESPSWQPCCHVAEWHAESLWRDEKMR